MNALASDLPLAVLGAGENDLSHELRICKGDHLRDHAAHRETEEINLVESQCADERDGVSSHLFDRVGRFAAGGTDAAIVEGDHAVFRGDAVDNPGIPVVEVGGEVVEKDDGYTGIDAQLAVDESSTADRNRFRRRVLVGGATPACARWSQMACGVVPRGAFVFHDHSLGKPIGIPLWRP
jgi:hypothetical protein